MKTISELHEYAMECAERALEAKRQGRMREAEDYFRMTLASEAQAAAMVAEKYELEPTRSVLHQSAATLALDSGEVREAERLIAVALSGNPPETVAQELRDLLEQVHFERHLALRGVRLEDQEFQMSLSGQAISWGMALTEAFVSRVQALQKLAY